MTPSDQLRAAASELRSLAVDLEAPAAPTCDGCHFNIVAPHPVVVPQPADRWLPRPVYHLGCYLTHTESGRAFHAELRSEVESELRSSTADRLADRLQSLVDELRASTE